MKRVGLFFILLVFLAGCSYSFSFDSGKDKAPKKEKEDIQLQVTKADEEAGFSAKNNELYDELEILLEENPDIGIKDDFSIQVITDITMETGEMFLLFLGVNRTNFGLDHVEFNFTLGSESEDLYIYDDTLVTLDHSELGVIKAGHAIPFTLPITQDEINFLMTIAEDDMVFEMENFEFDKVE